MADLDDIKQINQKALRKILIAQPILNKIKENPNLIYAHDPVLSVLREPRQNKYFVMHTLTDIMEMYMTENPDNIPEQVQNFVEKANNFLYGGSN